MMTVLNSSSKPLEFHWPLSNAFAQQHPPLHRTALAWLRPRLAPPGIRRATFAIRAIYTGQRPSRRRLWKGAPPGGGLACHKPSSDNYAMSKVFACHMAAAQTSGGPTASQFKWENSAICGAQKGFVHGNGKERLLVMARNCICRWHLCGHAAVVLRYSAAPTGWRDPTKESWQRRWSSPERQAPPTPLRRRGPRSWRPWRHPRWR